MSQYSDYINDERYEADNRREPVMETIDIVEVVSESPKAWFIKLREGNKISAHWFPKSQCTLSKDKKKITAPAWLLDAKGIA